MFEIGDQPTLEQVLSAREERVIKQISYLKSYTGTLICFNCNIPGPIKNNREIKQVFDEGYQVLKHIMFEHGIKIQFEKIDDLFTGPTGYMIVEEKPDKIKALTVEMEEQHALGRLWDFDVLFFNQEDKLNSLSREQFNYPKRQCFVCDKPAKECGRNRTHEMSEVLHHIEKIVRNYYKT